MGQPEQGHCENLKALTEEVKLLAGRATFQVVMSGVIGSAPPEEALEVVDFARAHGFTPRILWFMTRTAVAAVARGMSAYDEAKRRIGDRANEAFGYRGKMIESGEAPSKCRRAPAISTWTSSGACTGAIRPGGISPRSSSRTPMRTLESSSTRRKTASALHNRLRPNGLRDGPVALPKG